MSQSYELAVTGDSAAAAVFTKVPNALEALRSNFSGATAPVSPSPVAGQIWFDDALKVPKFFDGAEFVEATRRTVQIASRDLSNNLNMRLVGGSKKFVVESIALLGDVSVAASGTDKWVWSCRNLATSAALFSVNPDTNTVVAEVGGGALTADATYLLTPDQNVLLEPDQSLEFVATKNGEPAAQALFVCQINGYERLA